MNGFPIPTAEVRAIAVYNVQMCDLLPVGSPSRLNKYVVMVVVSQPDWKVIQVFIFKAFRRCVALR
ncbi:hypothetical protein F7734_10215 [Scytonema sp. UIC 10036]|uniref:hypothetical protein n=1 Tax=Scytonema sp. UIC 10036 TaxID=2304196 RepID=UPI0012DAACCB|nr:hypothetical protein [Scytonema sp. UIC 10036]MUG92803.1 hypothetical protein [Scytonema sp. UIC 10036]